MSDTDCLLLSKRAAARLLGVSRNKLLNEMIQDGSLETVWVGSRELIPREAAEKLARTGWQPKETITLHRTRKTKIEVTKAKRIDLDLL